MSSKKVQAFLQKLANTNTTDQQHSSISLYVKGTEHCKDYSTLEPIMHTKSPARPAKIEEKENHQIPLRNSQLKPAKTDVDHTNTLTDIESFLNQERNSQGSPSSNQEEDPQTIKCYAANIRLELNEAYKTIEVLKDALSNEKNKVDEIEKAFEEKQNKNEQECTTKYEALLEQRVATIENLINDKQDLCNKIKAMKESKMELEKAIAKNQKEFEEKHQFELKKAKESYSAAEKLRRDKWCVEKTEEIKKLTLKGIEPEISKLVAKHKQEMISLEDKHCDEIKNIKEAMLMERENKIKEVKEKLQAESEELLKKERAMYEEKIKQQYSRHEEQLNEQKNRWKETLEEERQRLEMLRKKDNDQYTSTFESTVKQYEEKLKSIEKACEDKIDELRRKNEMRITEIRNECQQENDQWKEKTLSKQKQELKAKIKQLQEQMIKDRNKEIEIIVNRLGDNTNEAKKKLINEYEQKIQEMNSKHQAESETQMKAADKWNNSYMELKANHESLKNKLGSIDTVISEKNSQIEDNAAEIKHLNDIIKSMNERVSNVDALINNSVREAVRKEQSNSERLNEENKISLQKMKEQYDKAIASYEEERKKEERDKASLSEKVMAAIDKREKQIKMLREEICIKESQIQKYVELLEKQRKDMLTKNR
jgi:5-azacytidine-induced protein 1